MGCDAPAGLRSYHRVGAEMRCTEVGCSGWGELLFPFPPHHPINSPWIQLASTSTGTLHPNGFRGTTLVSGANAGGGDKLPWGRATMGARSEPGVWGGASASRAGSAPLKFLRVS